MKVSILDPQVKILISMAQMALDKQLDAVIAKTTDHQKHDAIAAAKAAVDGAINALLAL